MKQITVNYALILLAICWLFPPSAVGATVNAASCSVASVQSAINSAASGDTVNVPLGTCTWSNGITIHGKTVTVQGAGASLTIINISSGFAFSISGTQSSRVTGFTINYTGGINTGGIVSIRGGTNWRIDHNTFNATYWQYGIFVDAISGSGINYIPYGVVDHNTISGMNILTFGRGHQEWAENTSLGAVSATYIEDNTFNVNNQTPDVADANYGGRVVFRYNRIIVAEEVTNSYYGNFQWHSLQSDGNVRGARKFEIYNNIWISYRNDGSAVALWPRSGTGVVYNNSFVNYGSGAMLLDNVRSIVPKDSYGLCDGTATGNIDGNQPGKQGYPCRDQVGRGKDASLFMFGFTPYPGQAPEPVYQWNNYRYSNLAAYNQGPSAGTVVDFYVSGQGLCKTHIVENRDFYNRTQKPGYTPYTYPHPLTTGESPSPSPTSQPEPPANLRVISSSQWD